MSDLDNHLFEQLERLNDDELSDDGLKKEIERSKSMAIVATKIIDSRRLQVTALKMIGDRFLTEDQVKQIGIGSNK